ncbi:MAG: hypothetical protein JO062_21600 [Bryobacterales bacterium]|nr:hypothetical protein [Bryobacterales bacterium]
MSPARILAASAAVLFVLPAGAHIKKERKPSAGVLRTAPVVKVLWRNPSDIASRNLYYGPGGKRDRPHGRMTFIKEDLNDTNPKFDVRDEDGVKWRVKLGFEARPETVASRLVWAAGYFANEDYFVQDLQIANMPQHLHRGQKLVSPDGWVHNVRLKRLPKDEKKIGSWSWAENPFTGTRELNGLRVMMALINNWDLTDWKTAIYEEKTTGAAVEQIYMVSDLGASFGTPRLTWPLKRTRGNLAMYRNSKLIAHEGPSFIDFTNPSRASLYLLAQPREYRLRLRLDWIGKHIPRGDAKWIGGVLARLSPDQIRDAFRAAGYSEDQIEAFTAALESRISEIQDL